MNGPTRCLYFANIAESSIQYEPEIKMLLDKYGSDVRQLQSNGTLKTLLLRTLLEKKKIIDVSNGVSTLVEIKDQLIPQCTRDFMADAHKIDFLGRTVTSFSEWYRIPIQTIIPQNWYFKKFVTALHESIQGLHQHRLLTGEQAPDHFSAVVSIAQESSDTLSLRFEINYRGLQCKPMNGNRLYRGSVHPL